MATLLEKVSTLISANLHSLVDKALQSNSLAVIDQYIRQVEDHLEDLEEAAATVGGEIKSLQRKLTEQEMKAGELDKAIDAFLTSGNDSAATASQSRLNSTQRLVDTFKEQITRLQDEYSKLLDAKVKLEARYSMMKQQRVELQSLLELAKSKEIVVKTMNGLDDIMGSGDSDISRIAQSIYARLDKATAATELRSTSLDEQINNVLDNDKISQQLDERRKKLSLNK